MELEPREGGGQVGYTPRAMSTRIHRLPDISKKAAVAAVEELRSHGWDSVLTPDGRGGNGVYRFSGKNPYGTVPLLGKLRIVGDVVSEIDESLVSDCCLVFEVEPGVELLTDQAKLAFETSVTYMVHDLFSGICGIAGPRQEIQ